MKGRLKNSWCKFVLFGILLFVQILAVCPAGEYSNSGSCVGCVAGSYCPGDDTITQCAADSWSSAGASSCTPCNAGFTNSGDFTACNPICGDGRKVAGEVCDDGDVSDASMCNSSCSGNVDGWHCSGGSVSTSSTCTEQCGDGYITTSEQCDDGNPNSNDGCSNTCQTETGYSCAATGTVPASSCSTVCGDGKVVGSEACDDGGEDNTSRCNSSCTGNVNGWYCTGGDSSTASTCTEQCGDGYITENELCDNGNPNSNDGCSNTCQVEAGYECEATGTIPESACSTVCGDGKVVGSEYCDDGNTSNWSRCNQDCTGNINGWTCTGGSASSASTCVTTCNDGYIAGSEQCEDGNLGDGDGCDSSCRVEAGFDCVNDDAKTSSICTAICGDGLKVQGEACDDGDSTDEQGCLADCSGEINGWHCSGGTLTTADTCVEQCNDGYITISEECEDSNLANGDGCSSSCLVETYWSCDISVSPNVCEPICGDGYFISGDEDCDDGNNYNGDGCDSNCKLETGWNCYDHDSDFYTPQECKKKCGNGIRPLSEQADEECDDGNTFGYDGCDHDCKLEFGYICAGGSATTPDICVENVFRPSANITLTQDNNAVIKFNDTIQRFTIGSDDLYIQIYGSQSSYNYTWTAEFVDDTTVNVNMNIISEITGNGEDIYFEFPLTNNFKSLASQRTVNPDQYLYFSLNKYQNSRSSGFLGQSSSYLFLASVLLAAISSFGGYSIEMMWKFTNSIQILFFMSYINVDLPANLEELFPYLGVSNAENIYFKQLCFMMFPEEGFTDQAINSKIESSSFFVINSDKIIWIIPVTMLLFVIKSVDLVMLLWKPCLLKFF